MDFLHQLTNTAFDLPKELGEHLNGQPPSIPQTPFGPGPPQTQPGDQKINGAPDSLLSPEDWSFLNEFGDPTDEFYTLDTDLRGLLDGEFAAGNSQFV